MAELTGALNAVSSKSGLALEVYGATITRFEEVNVFKELCTVKGITGGYSQRFDIRGGGSSDSIKQLAIGTAPSHSGLNLNKMNIEVERLFYDRKFIDNQERKQIHFSLLEVAVEENADAMAEFVDEQVLNQIDISMLKPQVLAEDGSGRVTQDTATIIDVSTEYASATTVEEEGDVVLEAMFKAGSALNRKKQKGKQRYMVLAPEVYTKLVLSKKALNGDYNDGSNGSIKMGNVLEINNMKIITSNAIPNPADASERFAFTGSTGDVYYGTSNTKGVSTYTGDPRTTTISTPTSAEGKEVIGFVLTEDVIGLTELSAIETDQWEEKKDKGWYVDIEYAFGLGTLNPASLVAIVA